jgi:uncharacterized protein (TIGR02001 family)
MTVSRSVAALCGAAGVALISLSGAALADEFAWSATATGTSDYVFRGISQTDNDAAIQGSIGATYGMFYAGVWASSLDFDNAPDVDIEIDYYAGITPKWGPATFDFGVIYYDYPDDSTLDYYELKAGVGGEIFSKLTAKGTFYWSPDILGEEWYVYEGTLAYALPSFYMFSPTISGLVGYTDFETSSQFDYTYWNAGLALTVEKLTFDFRYWDTDADATSCFGALASTCDERFVFSATLALP